MKILGFTLLAFLTWVLWLLVSQYLLCARFQFDDPVPFEGSIIFNPYDSIDAAKWVKCNFHAHSRAWEGFTNGHGSAQDIHQAYKALNYGVHCVSNYHYIDTTQASNPAYIPVYEHGYNMTKTHQLVLGSDKVLWLDYLFPQSADNKQHVLNHLSESAELVILNHPALKEGYTEQDLSQLNGYDCIEVLSPSVISTKHWDAALSAGKKVFIAGNDDTHNVLKKNRLGRMCTLVNVARNTAGNVLAALKTGRSYGVEIGPGQAVDALPFLKSVKVENDSVMIQMSIPASQVTLTGQNGKILASVDGTDRVAYRLSPLDHYARATFAYGNGTKVYLNPVFFTPKTGYRTPVSFENVGETIVYRAVGIAVLSVWALILLLQFPGIRRQRFERRRLSLR